MPNGVGAAWNSDAFRVSETGSKQIEKGSVLYVERRNVAEPKLFVVEGSTRLLADRGSARLSIHLPVNDDIAAILRRMQPRRQRFCAILPKAEQAFLVRVEL